MRLTATISAFLVSLTAALVHGPALAGSMGIAPVRVNFDVNQNSEVVQVQNTGTDELVIQVSAKHWIQDDGAAPDRYEPTDDLVAVPPVFSVPAGETQLVRVGYLGQPQPDVERSYRLFFTEITPAASEQQGVNLRLRMEVHTPLFVAPLAEIPPAFSIGGARQDGQLLTINVDNPGVRHVRVTRIEALADNGEEIASNAAQYVLGGANRELQIKLPEDFEAVWVILTTEDAGVREHGVDPSA